MNTITKTVEELQASLPLLRGLKWVREERDFIEVLNKPHSFIRDGLLYISTEHGDGAGDYYGDYINEWEQSGVPYINPALEAWANDQGGYFEWMDGGSIVFNRDGGF